MAPMAPSEFFCHKCGVRLPCYQHTPIEPDDATSGPTSSAAPDLLRPDLASERSPRRAAEAS